MMIDDCIPGSIDHPVMCSSTSLDPVAVTSTSYWPGVIGAYSVADGY